MVALLGLVLSNRLALGLDSMVAFAGMEQQVASRAFACCLGNIRFGKQRIP